jgi:hypothetical protein
MGDDKGGVAIRGFASARTLLLLATAGFVLPCVALAGRNANGALIVHVVDRGSYSHPVCTYNWDQHGVATCEDAVTQSNNDEATPPLVYLVAAFAPSGNPGVSVVYFGLDHNLPPGQGYFNVFGLCGPPGSLELPDAGWPDTGGNSVAFGSPVVGDTFFHFYFLNAFGFEGAYIGTAINPAGGYAAFVDDGSPPVLDMIHQFGKMRWYEPGYNECPGGPPPPTGACCFADGSCIVAEQPDCENQDGVYQGDGSTCEPNPCEPTAVVPGSWGRVKALFR